MYPFLDLIKHLHWDITLITEQKALLDNLELDNITLLDIDNLGKLKIKTDERTAIISMNKDIGDDVKIIKKFIRSKNIFLGVYGSNQKGQNLKKILLSELPSKSREISKIKIPLGLDIVVSNMVETSFSVISQLIKVFSTKSMLIPDNENSYEITIPKINIK